MNSFGVLLLKTNIKSAFVNSKYSTARTAYKSAISLANLYPNSDLKLHTPSKTPDLKGNFNGYIPIEQLEITYSRSSGPGGQNVNTVNTKVDMRFHLESATWLSSDTKIKLQEQHKTKITKEGYMVFRSELTRSQQLNLADCLEKLRTAIRNVEIKEPKVSEETAERIRRRYEKSVRERLALKRNRSQIKADRQPPVVDY